MTTSHSLDLLRGQLAGLDATTDSYATRFVEAILAAGLKLNASDVHLAPNGAGLDVRLRIDGVLQELGTFPSGVTADVIARLKVLADLLTYRTDIPQEGRIREPTAKIEMRVSTFPTLHGEKAVVRLFAAEARFPYLADLGLPSAVGQKLDRLLDESSGAILVVGPAGSGKTTTAYACLRELSRRAAGGRSIATLEDPIEVAVPGIAQSQVNSRVGFDLAAGLRALLRQDPQVIFVGEMRDPVTAGIALQASLTGQLVLTTFHASTAAGAVARLADMGLEPYVLRSGILAVLCQRLVRRLCTCAEESNAPEARLGLPVNKARVPRTCGSCHGTGYQGRAVLAEILTLEEPEIAAGVLAQWDMIKLEQAALAAGMVSRWQWACQAVEQGMTSAAEVRRVMGFSDALAPRDR